eukprot:COSAG06_NODE_2943_length_6053_cov_18.612361_1_plen_184_part_00
MRFLAGCGAIRFGVEVGLLCPVRAFPMLFVRACLGKFKSFSERKSLAGCWRRAVCHFLLSYQDRSFAKTASGQAEGREWWGTTKVICVLFFRSAGDVPNLPRLAVPFYGHVWPRARAGARAGAVARAGAGVGRGLGCFRAERNTRLFFLLLRFFLRTNERKANRYCVSFASKDRLAEHKLNTN